MTSAVLLCVPHLTVAPFLLGCRCCFLPVLLLSTTFHWDLWELPVFHSPQMNITSGFWGFPRGLPNLLVLSRDEEGALADQQLSWARAEGCAGRVGGTWGQRCPFPLQAFPSGLLELLSGNGEQMQCPVRAPAHASELPSVLCLYPQKLLESWDDDGKHQWNISYLTKLSFCISLKTQIPSLNKLKQLLLQTGKKDWLRSNSMLLEKKEQNRWAKCSCS